MIKYSIEIFGALLMSSLVVLYLWKRQLVCFQNLQSEKENQRLGLSKKKTVFFIIILLLLNCVTVWFIVKNTQSYINTIKLLTVLCALEIMSVTDYYLKIIPNFILLLLLAVRVVLYIVEFFVLKPKVLSIFVSDLIGFAFGFGILLVASLISKQAIGFGDVKLFGVLGLITGFQCTFFTLFIALVISAIVGIVLLIRKKINRKESMPFAPFVLIGFLVVLYTVSY